MNRRAAAECARCSQDENIFGRTKRIGILHHLLVVSKSASERCPQCYHLAMRKEGEESPYHQTFSCTYHSAARRFYLHFDQIPIL